MANTRGNRRPVSRSRDRQVPGLGRLTDLRSSVHQIPGVLGSWIGFRTVDGEATRDLALVVSVQRKRPKHLLRENELIPSHLAWSDRKRQTRRLRTDVVTAGRRARLKNGIAGPGDLALLSSGTSKSTVGPALLLADGTRALVTAGHAVNSSDWSAAISLPDGGIASGIVLSRVEDPWVDIALLGDISQVDLDNLYTDGSRVNGYESPTPSLVGSSVAVLSRRGPLVTVCRGVHADHVALGSWWRDCVVTDVRTQVGDSGALLVGQNNTALGVLRGEIEGQDFYVPITSVLVRTQAKLL